MAQVLRCYALAGVLSAERGREALEDLGDFPLTRYPHEVMLARIWELRETVTAYDAAYLALAEALDAPLVTRDRALARSRGHRARVEVLWRGGPAPAGPPGDGGRLRPALRSGGTG